MKEMKDKIKASLQQGYKNLGLSDEVFERVAQAAQTFITEEAQIEPFVSGAKSMLQLYQSEADKVRTALSDKIRSLEADKSALEAKLKEGSAEPANEPNDGKGAASDDAAVLAELVANAVAKAVEPLQAKLSAFESAEAQKGAVATAIGNIDAWDYAKAYPKERQRAQKTAMELYEAYGKKWTAAELEAKIREKFTDEVSDRGIDVTKPIKGDTAGEAAKIDFSDQIAMLEKQGVVLHDQESKTQN